MIGSSVLFDTNAFIAWMKKDPELSRVLGLEVSPTLKLISLGELEHGVSHSTHVQKNRAALESALKEVSILFPDRTTAHLYGGICAGTQRKGRPIPSNDAWIGALALQHRLPLLTRDTHFREIEELELLVW